MSQSSVHVLIHYMQPQAHMHTTHPRSPCSPCTSKTSPPACEPPLCIFSASEHFRCYLPSICQGSGLASSRDRRHVERPSLFLQSNSPIATANSFGPGEALAKIFPRPPLAWLILADGFSRSSISVRDPSRFTLKGWRWTRMACCT